MFNRILRPFVACLMICVVPAALFSSETEATARIIGNASVNGTASRNSRSIHDGDRLQTDAQSKMTVSASNAALGLIEKTDATYSSDSVKVTSGVVTVTTQSGYAAKYNKLSVRPATNQKAQYVVGELNGVSTVAALRGSVVVSDGIHSMIVPEGSALQQEPSSGGSNEKPSKRGAGAVPASSGVSGWVLIAIAGAAIAGTIGGLYAAGVIFQDSPSVSPSHP